MKSGEVMENEETKTTETTVENNTNVERPSSTPISTVIGPQEWYMFGRKTIYADYTEEQMNAQTIAKILNDVFSVHLENSNEIDYL